MHAFYRTTALTACLIMPLASQAQTVSQADAKKVEDSIKAYTPDSWSKPGFLTVKPSGDKFSLTLDLAIGLKEGLVPMVISEVTPLVQSLVKRADGMWDMTGGGPFTLMAQSPASSRSSSIKFNIGDYQTKGIFDPSVLSFRDIDVKLMDTNAVLRTGQDSVRFAMKDAGLITKAPKTDNGLSDVDATFAITAPTITFGAFPKPEVKVSAEQLDGAYKIGRLDLAGMGALTEFWKMTARGKGLEELDEPARARFKAIMAAHIPFLSEIGGELHAANVTVNSSGKTFSVGDLRYRSGLMELDNKGVGTIGADLKAISVGPGVWPTGIEKLLPSTASINVRYTGFDFDAIWKDGAIVRTKEEEAKLPRDHFFKSFMPGGKMRMDFTDTHARSEVFDLSVTGYVDTAWDNGRARYEGDVTVTAKDFDKTVKFLQENAKALPVLGQASFVALMAKGLGKAQSDGSLSWNVRFSPPGRTTVNGQPLPF